MREFKLDFIGVGAVKAGTTWLTQCMIEHDQIYMPNLKELNFFCMNHFWPSSPTSFNEGETWLKAKFSESKPSQLLGEFSPSYLIDPASPLLIKQYFPEIKLIISYRNPIDSLYSLYFQRAKEYSVPPLFEDFLEQYPQFINYGFYYSHTNRYLDHFQSENIHLILFDDIKDKPETVIHNLFSFLGVNLNFIPPNLFRKVNIRTSPRSILVRNVVGNTIEFFRNNKVGKKTKVYFRILGAHKIANWLTSHNQKNAIFPPMRPDTKSKLIEVFTKENESLGQLLGRDLSSWNVL